MTGLEMTQDTWDEWISLGRDIINGRDSYEDPDDYEGDRDYFASDGIWELLQGNSGEYPIPSDIAQLMYDIETERDPYASGWTEQVPDSEFNVMSYVFRDSMMGYKHSMTHRTLLVVDGGGDS